MSKKDKTTKIDTAQSQVPEDEALKTAQVPQSGSVDVEQGDHMSSSVVDDTDAAASAMAALSDNTDAQEVADPDPQTLVFEALTPEEGGSAATDEIDHIELVALLEHDNPSQTLPFATVKLTESTSPAAVTRISGAAQGTGSLAWGSRTDVGAVRTHNEDSFVIRFPMFAIADGMGGHAAGEVASTIAVSTLAQSAPTTPDHSALADAIERANHAVIEGTANGLGRPGMGTTCIAVIIDGSDMAVGHVGDSRCYLLHAGQLVRITHDHSYVEELVAAGEITPEEARIHPNRSIITRALGSDPSMQADHFMIEVARGDRILLCSDGLSSMIPDDVIEETMVSSPAPQACADTLVDEAIAAGGHDNVTAVVIDVKDDGVSMKARKTHGRNIVIAVVVVIAVLLIAWLSLFGISRSHWYLEDENGYVALYRGIPGFPSFLGLNQLEETTEIEVAQLSEAIEQRINSGEVTFDNEEDAQEVLDDYRAQLAENEHEVTVETESGEDA